MPRLADTNVLVYAVLSGPAETRKQAIAQELLETEDITLSVQVLQEFYHQATRPSRLRRLSHDDAMDFINDLAVDEVQDMTVDLFRRATTIAQRFQISYWDAAIIAAAEISGCDAVYSEDLNHGQSYGSVRVINPFAASGVGQPEATSQ